MTCWGDGVHVFDHQFMVLSLLGNDVSESIPIDAVDCGGFPIESMLDILHKLRRGGGFPYCCLVL